MKEERFDVVIVGAGPAGSVTAKKAAEQGLDVLMIERDQEIGVPVRCAEGVSKRIEQYVTVDKRWICAEAKGANIYSPDGTRVVMGGDKIDEVGYVLNRQLFDKFLAANAARAGAEIRIKTEAYGIIKEDGYVKGVNVRCASENENKRVYADVVVGADGVESLIGRLAEINRRLRPSEINVCAQFLMCDIEINKEYSEFFLGCEIAPKGYAWVFPKGDDCANVGVGIGGDVSGEGHHAIDYLKAFAANKFPAGKIIAEMCGAVPVSGPISESVANGVLLVGDAAWHVNPLTGGGILYSIRIGEIAGEVIAKAVQEGDLSKNRLREYDRRWRNMFGERFEIGLNAKEFFLNLSDEELNTLAHSLVGVKISELSSDALLLELVKRNSEMLEEFLKYFKSKP